MTTEYPDLLICTTCGWVHCAVPGIPLDRQHCWRADPGPLRPATAEELNRLPIGCTIQSARVLGRRIVISRDFTPFALSEEACARLEAMGLYLNPGNRGAELARDDPLLVQVVEELGEAANAKGEGGLSGFGSKLAVVETDEEWVVIGCDSQEFVLELTGRRRALCGPGERVTAKRQPQATALARSRCALTSIVPGMVYDARALAL